MIKIGPIKQSVEERTAPHFIILAERRKWLTRGEQKSTFVWSSVKKSSRKIKRPIHSFEHYQFTATQ